MFKEGEPMWEGDHLDDDDAGEWFFGYSRQKLHLRIRFKALLRRWWTWPLTWLLR
jgi:hypothetical protein